MQWVLLNAYNNCILNAHKQKAGRLSIDREGGWGGGDSEIIIKVIIAVNVGRAAIVLDGRRIKDESFIGAGASPWIPR